MSLLEILENSSIRRKIIQLFLETTKIINYDNIKKIVKNDTSRPDYHLNLLVENNLILRTKGRGNYQINEKQIQFLRSYFKIKVPICLLGGLGLELSLYVDIIDALKQISIIPNKYILITSPEIKKQFENLNSSEKTQMETVMYEYDYQKILREDYQKVHNVLKNLIQKEIYDFEIICELTGSTKPVSIALMALGEQYNLQRIYFSGKKLIWI